MLQTNIKHYYKVVVLFIISDLLFANSHSFNFETVRSLDNDTVEILKKYCNQKVNDVHSKKTIPPYQEIYLSCKDLTRSTIKFRKCGECINPFICKKIQGVKSEPINRREVIYNNKGSNFTVRLPIGCQCVRNH